MIAVQGGMIFDAGPFPAHMSAFVAAELPVMHCIVELLLAEGMLGTIHRLFVYSLRFYFPL